MPRLSRLFHATNVRFVTVLALGYLMILPPLWLASYLEDSATSKAASLSESVTNLKSSETNVARLIEPQSFGIVLTAVSGPFNGSVGISHHQPTNKVLTSNFYPSGQPHNFELVAADGAHTAFSNVAGISGELRIATARGEGQSTTVGGFTSGEVFTGTSVPGVIARIAADGSSIQNPWIILPGQTGLLNGGLHVDRTGVFGGDLIAATTLGGVWRITASGQATQIANLNTRLEGITVVPNDPDRYGPWSGKILTGAKEQGLVYALDPQGVSTSYQFGINPEDITVIPAHENFYGVDPSTQKIWGAPANAFTSIIGDVLIAQETPGTLSRVHWNGTDFEVSQIAQVTQWKQITFSPAGIAPLTSVRQLYDRIGIVRHAPMLDSGRVEGALWQLTGEATVLDGTDVITSDLLVPGTPTVTVSGSPNFEGTIQGTDNVQPAGYSVTITGSATLRHLITRTDPIQLETVAPPPAPAGTRDVTLTAANQSAGDWATLRNLTLSGQAGAITVPPGTYGAFTSGSHNAFVFGVANSTQPTNYNLESLALTGASQLILNGSVVLTVKNAVTLVGSTIGAADNPRQLLLKVSSTNTDAVKVSGTSVLYGIVRAPQGTITIEGHGRLRGTVACDRLAVSGAGILQLTESDIPPPPVNRPPTVDAGAAQSITLPTNTVNLNGFASDDGLPQGSTLSVSWAKVSGPGTVGFSAATNTSTNATFSAAGTYVLSLTASDTQLTSSDTLTITVVPNNQPPAVDAGADQTITLPNNASLNGTVSDDGLPSGSTVSVVWSKTGGPGNVTFGNSNIAVTTASFSAAGTYTLRLTANDTALTASDEIVITVNPASQPADVILTLEPSLAGPNVVGTSQTMRATLKHLSGVPVAGVSVQFAVTGANPTSGIVATDNAGLASFVYQGANSGTDSVQAAAELNGIALQSNVAQVTWVTPSMEVSTTTVYARFFTSNGSGSFTATPSQTPAFDQVFPTINFNPPAGTIPGAPPGVNFNSRPMVDVTTDLNGNFTGSIVCEGQGVQAGVGTLFNFNAVFTGTLIAAEAGDVTFRFYTDDGFILGVGNGATRVSGALDGAPPSGLSPFEHLPVLGAFNYPTPPIGSLVTIHFPAPGAYPYEVDYSECCGGELVLTMTTNANSGGGTGFTGVPPSESLVLTPNSVADRPRGGQQTFNVTAKNGAGVPLAGVPVLFSITGANAMSFGTTTNSLGGASFTYLGTFPGNDSIEAAATVAGRAIFSNRVTVKWLPSADPPPEQVLTPGQIGTPINGSTLTGVVPIKLGPGVTLTNGTVSYWPVSDPSDVHELATNAQGGPGDIIAMLDTTLLANDSYIIQLHSGPDAPFGPPPPDPDLFAMRFLTAGQSLDGENAADVAYSAHASESTAQTDEEVISQVIVTVIGEYKPGRITQSTTDFTIPVAGVPITVGRTYDSLERGHVGAFGHGWSLEIANPRLAVNPAHDVTLTEPSTGRRVTFKFTPRLLSTFLGFFYVPTFTPEPGVHGSLITNGCDILLRLGGQFTCALTGDLTFQPTAYQYTDAQGRAFVMTAPDGVLRSIKDLHGNLISFNPTGITSSAGGLNIPFERDSLGRITRITDPASNAWLYEYDEAGNLSHVRLPGITNPITYTYDASHLYTGATDPRGNVAVTATYNPDGRIATATDAAGNTTSYEYNLTTLTTTVTNPDGGHIAFHYDSIGQLLSQTDELGRTTTYTYDTDRNRLSQTNPLGQVTRYTYDEDGNQTSVTDPAGNISRATYNDFGGQATSTDELGNVRTIQYDANFSPANVSDSLGTIAAFTIDQQGNPLTVADGNGAILHLTYDIYGNLLTRTDPLGHTITYSYDQMGRVLTVTDARGNATHNAYDTLGRLATVTNALNGVTTYEYDANSNKTAEIDELGRRTTYLYDAANRLTRTTFPNNTQINYTYNFRDQKLTETDQSGRVTTYTYDLAGQLTRMKYADNAEVIHAYDAIGRETATTDERGNLTHYEYDPACTCSERVTKVIDALNHATVSKFDVAGRLTSIIDAATRETKFTYDVRNRLTLVAYPDNTTTLLSYDAAGHQLTETDQGGRLTSYSYDAAAELASVTNALNQITHYSYDPMRNLLSVTDANNHITSYEYDVLNRLTRLTPPLGTSETIAYDAVGNRTSRTDFSGKVTTYAYDSLNRLLSKTPAASLSEPVVSFTYTPTGRRATMVDASGTTTYTYNNRDRLTSKATPQGTLTYTYDAVGNPLSLLSSNANGASVNYAYDAVNRLQSVTDNRLSPGTTTYSYDTVNNLTGVLSANGVQSTVAYNALANPTDLTISKGGVLRSYVYTYNAAGQRLSATENSGRAVSYSYDAVARLTNETIANDPTPAKNGALTYSLDAVGNRLARTSTLAAISSTTSTYNANDRLNSDSYDANGNTTSADGKTYAYNFENRIKSMNAGALTVTYDGDGNPVAKTIAGVTTRYLVDDLNPTGFSQVIEEVVGSSVQRTYTYGTGLVSQKQLSSGQTSFFGTDAHSNVRLLTNTAGTVTDTYDFDAFGNLISATGATLNDYLYSGERFDSDLGAYHLRERDYNPQRGRFLTSDPFAGYIDLPRTLHKYLYVGVDPINFIDPSGLAETTEYRANVVRLRCASLVGLAGKIIVIGESMTRVITVAEMLGGLPYTPTAPLVPWANNSAWLRRYLRAGAQVIDIGFDENRLPRPPSTAYPKELDLLERWGKKGKLKLPVIRCTP